jgi:hypothetical protein
MDEDIIEATVRNAFVQGVDSVFLVDNASTDATLERGLAAGASVGEVFDYDRFDGGLIQTMVNAVVVRESLRSRAPYVWWLYLDSDEFPSGPGGLTIRDYLASLDRSFRIVGATFVNHLPHRKPEYLAGFHPIDFQPYCYPFLPKWESECGQDHWKHPLQRFDRDRPFIMCREGAHRVEGGDRGERWEPSESVVVHHFQYREERTTRGKLDLVCESPRSRFVRPNQIRDFHVRRKSLDAVYAQKWADVDTNSAETSGTENLAPWPHLRSVQRWYSSDQLESAIASSKDAEQLT